MEKTPIVIATGFTAAYLGDERSLREFIVGDFVTKNTQRKGENAVLYLVNDSYDPLTARQLRVAVNKDTKLIHKYEKFCGQPIAEIPDPFGCHTSYAEHFSDAMLQRLRSLDIHPVVLDAHKAYKSGHYKDYIKTTLDNYEHIQALLSERFDSYSMKNLFRAQCPTCNCLDVTNINKINDSDITFNCERCDTSHTQHIDELQGKLSWKLDCAARWNLYDIDIETFSKAHIEDLGSLAISSLISKNFFGGKIPKPIKYGAVNMNSELSYRLIEILPPQILKQLFTDHTSRDITLNKETVEHFCRKYFIRPDTSYVDFVNQELPLLAIQDMDPKAIINDGQNEDIKLSTLIEFGNRYSGYYYQKEYQISLAHAKNIQSADKVTAKTAQKFILYSLSIRDRKTDEEEINTLITIYLQEHQKKSRVYPYLRKIFGQQGGPTISTLLATLPYDYLNLMQMTLGYYAGETESSINDNNSNTNTLTHTNNNNPSKTKKQLHTLTGNDS